MEEDQQEEVPLLPPPLNLPILSPSSITSSSSSEGRAQPPTNIQPSTNPQPPTSLQPPTNRRPSANLQPSTDLHCAYSSIYQQEFMLEYDTYYWYELELLKE